MKNVLKMSPIYLFLITMAVIMLLYMAYVFNPLSAKVDELSQKNNALELQIKQGQTDLTNTKKLDEALSAAQGELDAINNRFDFKGAPPPVYDDLNFVAMQNGINISQVNVAPVPDFKKNGMNILKSTVQVRFNGSADTINNFINSFESMPNRFYRADVLTMEPFDGVNYDCALTLGVYYYGPAKQ